MSVAATNRPFSRRLARSALVLGALCLTALVAGGCVTDAAVRLAGCIEDAAGELDRSPELEELRRVCDPRFAGPSRVIAFPWAPISSGRLAEEGLDRAEIEQVNRMQGGLGPHARLNVIPVQDAGRRRERPSSTSYHDRFVDTPELLVCTAGPGPVEVVLQRRGGRALLVGLEAVEP